jgi:DNA helicase-2/ATP-dependent DNA helicase PcrA
LFALLSYFFDPVTTAPAGRGGRRVEVWGAHGNPDYAAFASTAPPPFFVSQGYASIQKQFRKLHGTIDVPDALVSPLLEYLDDIRAELVRENAAALASPARVRPPRLSLSGLVARLLSFEWFRNSGYTARLFRQALFTSLLEANIAPSRLTKMSLDGSLLPTVDGSGKVVWSDQYWSFLNTFGALLAERDFDDLEVEAFAENALAMLTFHQAKGLEFDHVYVGLTGRSAQIGSALQTALFSGRRIRFDTSSGTLRTRDPEILGLAAADRDREVYVALTRPRSTLTILVDPNDGRPLTDLNDGLTATFANSPRTRIDGHPDLRQRLFVR